MSSLNESSPAVIKTLSMATSSNSCTILIGCSRTRGGLVVKTNELRKILLVWMHLFLFVCFDRVCIHDALSTFHPDIQHSLQVSRCCRLDCDQTMTKVIHIIQYDRLGRPVREAGPG
jgi:hypothetical protein